MDDEDQNRYAEAEMGCGLYKGFERRVCQFKKSL